ncbi:GNAT family N-acetyltransferase [Verrucomicrobiales bacterium]|nr:GNAT family N-acetyltransferase [Verrucomicrobiales bacterium]
MKRNAQVVALLPCYRNGSRLRLAGDALCDFQDIISLTQEDAEQFMIELFSHARKENLHFHFHQLSNRGNLCPLIKIYANSTGFDYYQKTIGPCPWFKLAEDGETFLVATKAKLRKRVRRALRKLEELAPEHKYSILDHSQITSSTIDDIAALHKRNQHRKEGDSIFENQSYRKFIPEAAQEPDTGIHIIEVRAKSGELIAFDFGFHADSRFYAYLGSCDEPSSGGSPCVCFLHWQMDKLPLMGIRDYDFLCGSEGCKFDYAEDHYKILSVKIYSCGLINSIKLMAYRNGREIEGGFETILQASHKRLAFAFRAKASFKKH